MQKNAQSNQIRIELEVAKRLNADIIQIYSNIEKDIKGCMPLNPGQGLSIDMQKKQNL